MMTCKNCLHEEHEHQFRTEYCTQPGCPCQNLVQDLKEDMD